MSTQTHRAIHLPSLGLSPLVGLLLLGVVGWTYATPTNSPTLGFRAGQLSFTAVHARTGQPFGSGPLFSAVVLTPGQAVAESVRVRNTGDVPFALHLRAAPSGALEAAGPLWEAEGGLQAQVERADGTIVYRGSLRALDAKLRGRMDAQEEDHFRVSVWLAPGAHAAPVGNSAAVSFSLHAEQVL